MKASGSFGRQENRIEQLEEYGSVDFVVRDEADRYLGMLTTNDIQLALVEREAVPLLVVHEVMRTAIPSVCPDETLDSVFSKFADHEVSALAIADPGDDRVIGTMTRTAAMGAYLQALTE